MAKTVTKQEYVETCERMARLNLEKFDEALAKFENAETQQERDDYKLEAEGWAEWAKTWKWRATSGDVSELN